MLLDQRQRRMKQQVRTQVTFTQEAYRENPSSKDPRAKMTIFKDTLLSVKL